MRRPAQISVRNFCEGLITYKPCYNDVRGKYRHVFCFHVWPEIGFSFRSELKDLKHHVAARSKFKIQ